MKTFREIAEMHYASEPSNEFDKQYRENRINALEKLLTEQLRIHDVVGQSEQLPNKCKVCGRTDEERLTMTSMCGVSACPY